jgi:hypothetical protein
MQTTQTNRFFTVEGSGLKDNVSMHVIKTRDNKIIIVKDGNSLMSAYVEYMQHKQSIR